MSPISLAAAVLLIAVGASASAGLWTKTCLLNGPIPYMIDYDPYLFLGRWEIKGLVHTPVVGLKNLKVEVKTHTKVKNYYLQDWYCSFITPQLGKTEVDVQLKVNVTVPIYTTYKTFLVDPKIPYNTCLYVLSTDYESCAITYLKVSTMQGVFVERLSNLMLLVRPGASYDTCLHRKIITAPIYKLCPEASIYEPFFTYL